MISDRVKRNLKTTFRNSLLAKLGASLLAAIGFVAIFAPLLATHDPTSTGYFNPDGQPYPPVGFEYSAQTASGGEIRDLTVTPTSEHLLGTNIIGQDVYSRFLYGARVSVLVALVGVILAALIGVPTGLVAGYYGGRTDDGLMRIADIMLSFPALILALALIGAFGESTVEVPDPIVLVGTASWAPQALTDRVADMPEVIPLPGTVTLVVALVTWVWFARVARGEALSIRNEEYVTAARSFGTSDWTILRKHVFPNAVTPIIVLGTIQVAVIILLEASLSFLGFSGTTLSWGYEIESGQDYLRTRPWVSVIPGIGIVLTVIGINLLGDWFRDALDPNIDDSERGAA